MTDRRYSIIPARAVVDPRLEGRDLQVLCYLGMHTDKLGWCVLSQVVAAEKIGVGRSTVQRSLARLTEAGWVQVRTGGMIAGRPHASNAYRVVMDLDDPQVDPAEIEIEHHFEGEGCPPVGTPVPSLDGQGCPPAGTGVPTHTRAHNDQDSAAAVVGCGPAISESSWKIASTLAVIAGHSHDPPTWPASWCGAPMRVQGWLNEGWTAPLIEIGARKAAARKPPGSIRTVEFFEGAIADEIARQARPLPKGVTDEKTGSDRPRRQSAGVGFAAFAVARARASGRT